MFLNFKKILPRSLRYQIRIFIDFFKSPSTFFDECKIHRKRLRFYKTFIRSKDLVFDIGANIGNRSLVFRDLGAKVIAIEPQHDCVQVLRMRFGNRITVLEKGISDSRGVLKLNVSNVHMLSTFRQQFYEATANSRFHNASWNKTIDVEVITLDNVIDVYGMPDFVKIDVEGFELRVFMGLTRKLHHFSFEYAVPEFLADVINCLVRVEEIDKGYVCNYSIGESMKMCFDKYMPISEFLSMVKSDPSFTLTGFGDIYCKLPN